MHIAKAQYTMSKNFSGINSSQTSPTIISEQEMQDVKEMLLDRRKAQSQLKPSAIKLQGFNIGSILRQKDAATCDKLVQMRNAIAAKQRQQTSRAVA